MFSWEKMITIIFPAFGMIKSENLNILFPLIISKPRDFIYPKHSIKEQSGLTVTNHQLTDY